jgi:hypothetical protein
MIDDGLQDPRRAGGLPKEPDFRSMDEAAPTTADKRTFLLALIGNLSFVWSNNESMFIYLTKVLLQTDEASAVIVFVSLTTARSRIELVERLAKAKVKDLTLLSDLNAVVARFNECTKVRNEFNHCMYAVDVSGALSATQSFRIRDVDGAPTLERPKPIDEARIERLVATIEDMKAINRDIWTLLPRLQDHLGSVSATFP